MKLNYLDGKCQHALQEQGIAKTKQPECTLVHEDCGFWRMTLLLQMQGEQLL